MGTKFSKIKTSSKKKSKKIPKSSLQCEIDRELVEGWKFTQIHIQTLKKILVKYNLTNDILNELIKYVPKSEEPKLDVFKIIVDGNGGVGKSSLIVRHLLDKFLTDLDPTIEDIYYKITPIFGKNTNIKLGMLDIAGREEFCSLREQWYKNNDLLMLCCSCSYPDSITHEMDHRTRTYFGDRIINDKPMIIVITKCDLSEFYSIYVSKIREGVLNKCEEMKIPYFETSSKESVNTEYLWQLVYLEYLYMINVPKENRNITKVFYTSPKRV